MSGDHGYGDAVHPIDLEEIRARDKIQGIEWFGEKGMGCGRAGAMTKKAVKHIHQDRKALLAEVDRLRELMPKIFFEALQQGGE